MPGIDINIFLHAFCDDSTRHRVVCDLLGVEGARLDVAFSRPILAELYRPRNHLWRSARK